jgi:hypothetical protein
VVNVTLTKRLYVHRRIRSALRWASKEGIAPVTALNEAAAATDGNLLIITRAMLLLFELCKQSV